MSGDGREGSLERAATALERRHQVAHREQGSQGEFPLHPNGLVPALGLCMMAKGSSSCLQGLLQGSRRGGTGCGQAANVGTERALGLKHCCIVAGLIPCL